MENNNKILLGGKLKQNYTNNSFLVYTHLNSLSGKQDYTFQYSFVVVGIDPTGIVDDIIFWLGDLLNETEL